MFADNLNLRLYTQASVLDTMNVAMGVTLREGGGAKTGAPLHSVGGL
jgi:hypothetical protein